MDCSSSVLYENLSCYYHWRKQRKRLCGICMGVFCFPRVDMFDGIRLKKGGKYSDFVSVLTGLLWAPSVFTGYFKGAIQNHRGVWGLCDMLVLTKATESLLANWKNVFFRPSQQISLCFVFELQFSLHSLRSSLCSPLGWDFPFNMWQGTFLDWEKAMTMSLYSIIFCIV